MTQRTVEEAMQIALQHHQTGRLPQAEQLYRQILVQQPNHGEALHLLGVIAGQVGRSDDAVQLISRAIALRPDFPEAYCNLGNVLKDKGQFDEAIASYRRAIALNPGYADAHYNLGNSLMNTGLLDAAIASFHQAIAQQPNFPIARYALGNALKAKCQPEAAIAAFRAAIVQMPIYPQAYNHLGNVLRDTGRLDEAIDAYRRAIALKSDFPEAHNNLGNAQKDKGKLDEAVASYRASIGFKPNLPEVHCNLGNALQAIGLIDQAIAAYRAALALDPGHRESHLNLALSLLVGGDFLQGWDEYEWRWRQEGFPVPRSFPQPLWDGQAFSGSTLLIHAEQGFGDTIQFIRYLPLAARRGGKIIVECQPELHSLVRAIAGECSVIASGQPLPPFDIHCSLLSLPRVFQTTLKNIPREVPYLHADAAKTEQWRRRFEEDSASLKVGLAWAGSPIHKGDRNRSMDLAAFAPLACLEGIRFYSLQKGEQADKAKNPPTGLKMIDLTRELKDFSDTAALIADLDLVISVDTAVAHLAGALGKSVWVMLPFAPDWRWLLEREDSPWYPSMRLFRQPSIGNWESVVRRVADALASRMRMPGGTP